MGARGRVAAARAGTMAVSVKKGAVLGCTYRSGRSRGSKLDNGIARSDAHRGDNPAFSVEWYRTSLTSVASRLSRVFESGRRRPVLANLIPALLHTLPMPLVARFADAEPQTRATGPPAPCRSQTTGPSPQTCPYKSSQAVPDTLAARPAYYAHTASCPSAGSTKLKHRSC